MTKYVHIKLQDYIKSDARLIRKHAKDNEKLPLTKIYNLLSKFFGFRHYHELERIHFSGEWEKPAYTNLTYLPETEMSSLKWNYFNYIRQHMNFVDENKISLERIKSPHSAVVNRLSKDSDTFNFMIIESFIALNNYDFESILENYLAKCQSDPYYKHLSINLNKLIFKILAHTKSENYQKDYQNYLSFDDILRWSAENSSFSCSELTMHLEFMNYKGSKANVTNYEMHGYTIMPIFAFVLSKGLKWNDKLNPVVIDTLKKGSQDIEFIYENNNVNRVLFESVAEKINCHDNSKRRTLKDTVTEISKRSCGLYISSQKDDVMEMNIVKSLFDELNDSKCDNKIRVGLIGFKEEELSELFSKKLDFSAFGIADKNNKDKPLNIQDQIMVAIRNDPDLVIVKDSDGTCDNKCIYDLYQSGYLVLFLTQKHFNREMFLRQDELTGVHYVRDI